MLSRAHGCILGQLAGDSLGSLVEFRSAADIGREHPGGVRLLRDGGTWNTLAGQPTDDSEMALILARSIVQEGGYTPAAAARAYAWWYKSHPFDIGNTTRTALAPAAAALGVGLQPAEEARKQGNGESQANGALMRVSPLGILAAGAKRSTGMLWAKEDAALTHPNPVCQGANAVFASAVAFAIRTEESPQAVYFYALNAAREMPATTAVMNVLEAATNSRPADYTRNMGWVLIALQNAFWQLLHTSSLEEGIAGTVELGGDTDTNGAIAGALLGAVHGRAAVPQQWMSRILSCRPLAGIPGVARAQLRSGLLTLCGWRSVCYSWGRPHEQDGTALGNREDSASAPRCPLATIIEETRACPGDPNAPTSRGLPGGLIQRRNRR
jgi:ADP-ribosyl-[dinitrogen reductase] hydrolase